jgi:hypothetical protein
LKALSQKILYNDLPSAIISHHVDFSMRLIFNQSLRFNRLDKKVIIANLNSCLNQAEESYSLNIEAFRQHTANFRSETLNSFFASVGVTTILNTIQKDIQMTSF